MGLANALPAVCSAIGSNKFEELAGVTSINRSGPANGSNVYFGFRLTSESSMERVAPHPCTQAKKSAPTGQPLDFKEALESLV